jgi:hypothetical protein
MPKRRADAIARLRRTLERRGSPRAEMAAIAVCTGTAGFLASAILLRFGVEAMWLRYLLALLVAFQLFLLLVRLWAHLHGRKLRAGEVLDIVDAITDVPIPRVGLPGGGRGFAGAGGRFGGGGASAKIDAAPSFVAATEAPRSGGGGGLDLDLDEAFVPLVIAVALVAALLAALWIVYVAPGLLAELLVDGALAGGLYHRLRGAEPRSWLAIAVRRTALPFAITATLVVFAGWYAQQKYPEARSIGDVIRHARR